MGAPWVFGVHIRLPEFGEHPIAGTPGMQDLGPWGGSGQ